MSETCPTVKIVADNEAGHVVINEEDFDKKTMKLAKGETEPAAAEPAAE